MKDGDNFPGKGTITRKVFIGVIAALAFTFVLAVVVGPVFTANDADTRPLAAVLSAATYLAFFVMLGWFGWMILRPRRRDRRRDR
jgi:hypothetical protein